MTTGLTSFVHGRAACPWPSYGYEIKQRCANAAVQALIEQYDHEDHLTEAASSDRFFEGVSKAGLYKLVPGRVNRRCMVDLVIDQTRRQHKMATLL